MSNQPEILDQDLTQMSREELIKQAKYCDSDTLGKIILNLTDAHTKTDEIQSRINKIYDIFLKRKVANLLTHIQDDNPQLIHRITEMNKMSLPAEYHERVAEDAQKQFDKLVKSYGMKDQLPTKKDQK